MEKVVLGLSGGVDSALCARILLEKGYQVTGVYLDTGSDGVEEARKAALELGIPFLPVDVKEQLEEKVIIPFMEGYRRGITPIPCIFCNPAVKFHVLWQKAQELGASYVATGHYAVTRRLENGITGLYMSSSPNDQSYMLYRLPPALLDHILFPLGELSSKEDTRALARKAGLSSAEKPDSMEICFIPEGDHAAFMEQRGLGLPPGDFVDEEGHVLGKHKGIHHYTLGQRRGLGIGFGQRMFVCGIDPEQNTVTLTSGEGLFRSTLTAGEVNLIEVEALTGPVRVTAKIRYAAKPAEALLTPLADGRVQVVFDEPQRAITPGQALVLYDGDTVVGGGRIVRN